MHASVMKRDLENSLRALDDIKSHMNPGTNCSHEAEAPVAWPKPRQKNDRGASGNSHVVDEKMPRRQMMRPSVGPPRGRLKLGYTPASTAELLQARAKQLGDSAGADGADGEIDMDDPLTPQQRTKCKLVFTVAFALCSIAILSPVLLTPAKQPMSAAQSERPSYDTDEGESYDSYGLYSYETAVASASRRAHHPPMPASPSSITAQRWPPPPRPPAPPPPPLPLPPPPPPPPPPPHPSPPHPSPPPPTPRTVTERINDRFHNPVSESSTLATTGVLLHILDGWEVYGQPWKMAIMKGGGDGFQDRICASLVYAAQPHTYADLVSSGTYKGGGGFIIHPSPEMITVLCSYGADGGTRKIECGGGGVTSSCLPGCIARYDSKARDAYDDWARFCNPRVDDLTDGWYGAHCGGHPWRPEDIGQFLVHDSRKNVEKMATPYNEFVIDGAVSNAHLPYSIEAVFYLKTDQDGGAAAKKVHEDFLAAYPEINDWEVPLLVYDPHAKDGPFLHPPTPEQESSALDPMVQEQPVQETEAVPFVTGVNTASGVAASINHRYHHVKPGSSKLGSAGVLIHITDGWEQPGKPWQMACTAVGCLFGDRISASIIAAGQTSSFADGSSSSYNGHGGGFVIRPSTATTRVLCSYGGDGHTRKIDCNPLGVSSTCIPGCIRAYNSATHNAWDDWARWCEPSSDVLEPGAWCGGRPWRPADLGSMLDIDLNKVFSDRGDGYNEVVLDGKRANDELPYSIEAMFYLKQDVDGGATARQVYAEFLATYPEISESDIPLLLYDPDAESGPFLLPSDVSPPSTTGTVASYTANPTRETQREVVTGPDITEQEAVELEFPVGLG